MQATPEQNSLVPAHTPLAAVPVPKGPAKTLEALGRKKPAAAGQSSPARKKSSPLPAHTTLVPMERSPSLEVPLAG